LLLLLLLLLPVWSWMLLLLLLLLLPVWSWMLLLLLLLLFCSWVVLGSSQQLRGHLACQLQCFCLCQDRDAAAVPGEC
jgi:hypothetical protein